MMTLFDAYQALRPAIMLERIIARRTLRYLRVGGISLASVGAVAALGGTLAPSVLTELPAISSYPRFFLGIGILGIAVWADAFLASCYHNHAYFSGLRRSPDTTASQDAITYDVALAIQQDPQDLTRALLTSTLGQSAIIRAGIDLDQVSKYITNTRTPITADSVLLKPGTPLDLVGLTSYVLTHDTSLTSWLQQTGTQTNTFLGAMRWVVGEQHRYKRQQQWWSFENLSKTTGFGRELSFGVPYHLERFSRAINTSAVFSTLTRHATYATEKIEQIERILSSQKASNVLIVGAAGVGKLDLVMEVKRRLRTGQAIDAIRHEHIYVLDTTRLFATHSEKQSLEQTFIRLFDEATRAGKVIIVIENLSNVVAEAQALGVFLPDLLDPYLATQQIHFIATDTPEQYHTSLETRTGFMRRFTEVLIETPNNESIVRILQSIALREEIKHNVLITYPALSAVAEAADRYLVDGVMPDKAVTFLLAVVGKARSSQVSIITPDLVYEAVTERTGMPAGPVSDNERDQLLHLEDTLHQLVIGQQSAINTIAGTMRRARVHIQASDKPIGSFLFLGPTGVGKTETAKALAAVFFGGEEHLQRLDMSEYSGVDAVTKLIGDSSSSGSLSNILREHPYSVVLLDEFEKANQSVHDIFLQLLDEGQFTDGRGQTINGRNAIIIATSNAGSRLILETVSARQDLNTLNDQLIGHIIAEGIYRPELINRFDDTIIFEPLTRSEQIDIARLQLRRLADRLRAQGYELVIDDMLASFVIDQGYSSEFGARPMQRVIQHTVEEAIATNIITQALKPGDSIRLTQEELDKG